MGHPTKRVATSGQLRCTTGGTMLHGSNATCRDSWQEVTRQWLAEKWSSLHTATTISSLASSHLQTSRLQRLQLLVKQSPQENERTITNSMCYFQMSMHFHHCMFIACLLQNRPQTCTDTPQICEANVRSSRLCRAASLHLGDSRNRCSATYRR